jgi:hypothetical protein
MDPNLILNRLMRLAQLDTSPFDEVRDDQKETLPAFLIVAVSALLAGFGATLWLFFEKEDGLDLDIGRVLLYIWILGTIVTVILWAVWVGLTGVILQSFFKEPVDMMSLFRTMGYASFPFAASFLMLVPFLAMGIGLTALVAWFVLSIFAAQAATGAESGKVIKATLVGFLAFALISGIFARGSGIATGVFLHSDSQTIAEGEYYEFEGFDDDDFDCIPISDADREALEDAGQDVSIYCD